MATPTTSAELIPGTACTSLWTGLPTTGTATTITETGATQAFHSVAASRFFDVYPAARTTLGMLPHPLLGQLVDIVVIVVSRVTTQRHFLRRFGTKGATQNCQDVLLGHMLSAKWALRSAAIITSQFQYLHPLFQTFPAAAMGTPGKDAHRG